MADKKCQQNFGGWETTGLMVTDLVEDRKMSYMSTKGKVKN